MTIKQTDTEDRGVDARYLYPHQIGWMRRSDLEDDQFQVWERPDGTLLKHPKARGQLVVLIPRMR